MKKVVFVQLFGKSFGGVWQVIKLVSENLVKDEQYDVSVISLRANIVDKVQEEVDPKVKMYTINETDGWNIQLYSDIVKQASKLHLIKACKMLASRIKFNIKLANDGKKLKELIREIDPDYIVGGHYQLLDLLPKEYLDRTIHQQHCAFKEAYRHKANRETLEKYNGKIKFLWLSKASALEGQKVGLKNNYYIHNAARFNLDEKADVIKNKTIICMSRLSEEKRVDLMVDIVKEVFKDERFSNWKMEIYGTGNQLEVVKKHIGDCQQIKLMGLTNEVIDKYLHSSINLNTSEYEGFSMTILEAGEAGLPSITFNYGEPVFEQVIDGVNGYIAKDFDDYVRILKDLLSDEEKLAKLSISTKEYAKNFRIENIIKDWKELLK